MVFLPVHPKTRLHLISRPSDPTRAAPGIILVGAGLFVLLTISLLIHLGLTPLRMEEPRRALIALEMLFRDNMIVPTEMGEFYYKKPPVFNWLLLASYRLWGVSEWATRIFSIFSFLGMGGLVFFMGQRYVSRTFGLYSGLLTLTMVDIIFYFSTVGGEIDLFYSFITLASFFTLFHFYEQQRYFMAFISTYALGAVGALTKGLPSLVFLGISILVWLIYRRDIKRLWSPAHLVGVAVFITMVGAYFGYYHQFNDATRYFTSEASLWSQSSERTLLKNSVGALLAHLLVFPLETLMHVAPATLLLPFLVRKNIVHTLFQKPFIAYCLLLLLSNGAVYWISPGTRSRYVYMLYPLLVVLLTYGFYTYPLRPDLRHRIFRIAVRVLIGLTVLAGLALPWVPTPTSSLPLLPLGIIMVLAGLGLLIGQYRRPAHSLLFAVALVILLRLVFDFTILPARARHSKALTFKQNGKRIAQLTQGQPLHLYPNTRFSLTTVFYIERERQEVLSYQDAVHHQDFYLVDSEQVLPEKYTIFHTFDYQDRPFLLIKFREPSLHPDPPR